LKNYKKLQRQPMKKDKIVPNFDDK
jgi:hypothetical protein